MRGDVPISPTKAKHTREISDSAPMGVGKRQPQLYSISLSLKSNCGLDSPLLAAPTRSHLAGRGLCTAITLLDALTEPASAWQQPAACAASWTHSAPCTSP